MGNRIPCQTFSGDMFANSPFPKPIFLEQLKNFPIPVAFFFLRDIIHSVSAKGSDETMKLHYKGKYDLNPESLPHGEHMPGAVKFKEAEDTKKMAWIGNLIGIGLLILFGVPAFLRCKTYILDNIGMIWLGSILSMLTLFPHELLHAICFREDVYLYTNLAQGMLFVIGPETMTRRHFVFMSLLPNLVFGFLPYLVGMFLPQYPILLCFGLMSITCGAGDYYNVFNAMTQMPKGARTYLYQFHSYWYLP